MILKNIIQRCSATVSIPGSALLVECFELNKIFNSYLTTTTFSRQGHNGRHSVSVLRTFLVEAREKPFVGECKRRWRKYNNVLFAVDGKGGDIIILCLCVFLQGRPKLSTAHFQWEGSGGEGYEKRSLGAGLQVGTQDGKSHSQRPSNNVQHKSDQGWGGSPSGFQWV